MDIFDSNKSFIDKLVLRLVVWFINRRLKRLKSIKCGGYSMKITTSLKGFRIGVNAKGVDKDVDALDAEIKVDESTSDIECTNEEIQTLVQSLDHRFDGVKDAFVAPIIDCVCRNADKMSDAFVAEKLQGTTGAQPVGDISRDQM